MSIQCEFNHRNLIVRIQGDIDHHETNKIRDKIDTYLRNGQAKNIVFDFNGVTFMDSSGIGLLMGRYRQVKQMEGQVVLSNVSPQLDRILKISGVYTLMENYTSLEEALKAI